jgi:hypothetical protein
MTKIGFKTAYMIALIAEGKEPCRPSRAAEAQGRPTRQKT